LYSGSRLFSPRKIKRGRFPSNGSKTSLQRLKPIASQSPACYNKGEKTDNKDRLYKKGRHLWNIIRKQSMN
jgi:hypothetical protein